MKRELTVLAAGLCLAAAAAGTPMDALVNGNVARMVDARL
jgi:hypothetical protein